MGKVVVNPQQPIVVKVKPGGGSGADQFARDRANAAFNKANSVVQKGWTTVNIAGHPIVSANSNNEILTLIQGVGILLDSDPANQAVIITATGGSAFDEVARNLANSAVRTGYTTYVANGVSLQPRSNADTLIITGVSGNGIGIRANAQTQTIDFSLQPLSITPGTYGNNNQLLQITVDMFGRVISVSNVIPTFDTSVLTTGILTPTRGGTGANVYTNRQILIGNSISGGLDVATLQTGTGISLNVTQNTINLSSNLTLPVQSRSISYGGPLLNEFITYFWTNTAITFSHMHSVVAGTTPNATIDILYTSDRSNTLGTTILGNLICNNTTTGTESTSFQNATVPANNFILIHTTALSGTVDEIALTSFFSN